LPEKKRGEKMGGQGRNKRLPRSFRVRGTCEPERKSGSNPKWD